MKIVVSISNLFQLGTSKANFRLIWGKIVTSDGYFFVDFVTFCKEMYHKDKASIFLSLDGNFTLKTQTPKFPGIDALKLNRIGVLNSTKWGHFGHKTQNLSR